MSSPTAAIIFSATPLARELRTEFQSKYGENVDFMELPTLRRHGLGQLFRTLRSLQTEVLIVSGYADDLQLFRDYLLLLALLVRAPSRMIELSGQPAARISLLQAPRACLRIILGGVFGIASLMLSRYRVSRLTSIGRGSPTSWAGFEKCLYLKPVLMFGLQVGGSVGHVAGVANAIARRGTFVRMLSANEQLLLDKEIVQNQIKPPSLVAMPYELNQHLYQNRFLSKAVREVRDFKPGFLYQRYCLNDLTGLELRRKFSIPLIMEYNGSEVWVQKHWGRELRFARLAEDIEKANLRLADLVVVVSEEVRKDVLGAGVPAERVLFYPNCVDSRMFDPSRFDEEFRRKTRKRLLVPADCDLFTFVGTFGLWHGTEILAEAIRKLIDQSADWLKSQKIHFLFVGDGVRASAVRAILGPGLDSGFVTLAGLRPQGETPEILAASDVLVSPHAPNVDGTPFFGSPTKLFEYMAMERLIVASDLDQIGWVLRGGQASSTKSGEKGGERAAILVEPGDVNSLIDGLRQAAEMDPQSRRAVALRARSHVLQGFTWDRNVEAVLQRFGDLLKNAAKPSSMPGAADCETGPASI